MPNCAWPLLETVTVGDGGVSLQRRLEPRAAARRPAHRALHRFRRGVARGRIGQALVEHHRDVRAEPGLDVDGPLGRELMPRAVEVRLELGAVLADDPPLGEAEHLKAAAVGEHRAIPADESMQAAPPRDQLVAGPEEQVIGVAEDDLGAAVGDVAVQGGLDRSLRADGHERRRLHDAVRRLEAAEAGRAVGRA